MSLDALRTYRWIQIAQLQIVIALSQFYTHLSRDLLASARAHLGLRTIRTDVPLQRVYLMPTPTSPAGPGSPSDARASHHFASRGGDVAVYATIPIGGMTEEEARNMHATEAWIAPSPSSPKAHRHSHSHAHSHSHSHSHSPSHSHSHAHAHRHHPSRSSSSSGSRPVSDEKKALVD